MRSFITCILRQTSAGRESVASGITETGRVSETSCFSSNYLESGRWAKSENPIILCVIHHRQNPIESIRLFKLKQSYVGVLTSLWLFLFLMFLFAAKPKEFFLAGLKKLEQRSHNCVELRGQYVE
jgi:hypothetical protein